jgi:hypothetical protein
MADSRLQFRIGGYGSVQHATYGWVHHDCFNLRTRAPAIAAAAFCVLGFAAYGAHGPGPTPPILTRPSPTRFRASITARPAFSSKACCACLNSRARATPARSSRRIPCPLIPARPIRFHRGHWSTRPAWGPYSTRTSASFAIPNRRSGAVRPRPIQRTSLRLDLAAPTRTAVRGARRCVRETRFKFSGRRTRRRRAQSVTVQGRSDAPDCIAATGLSH